MESPFIFSSPLLGRDQAPAPPLSNAGRRAEAVDLGLIEYEEALRLQHRLLEEVALGRPEVLLLLEHPDVYTYGRKSEAPAEGGVAVERGGEATFHNPGQLVAYPLLRLEGAERDLHLHLRRLEGVVIELCEAFGVEASRRQGATGVWVRSQTRKIASIGVAVSRWVTYHGVALNVDNELKGFQKISPCGFSANVMISLKEELGEPSLSMAEVKGRFLDAFERHFDRSFGDLVHGDGVAVAIGSNIKGSDGQETGKSFDR